MVSQFAEWFKATMQAPEIKPRLAGQGFLPVGMCGADFSALLRREYDHYGGIIRATNIKAE